MADAAVRRRDDLERVAPMYAASKALLAKTVDRLHLSARAYMKVWRLARTIADLEGRDAVSRAHFAEAVGLRCLDLAKDIATRTGDVETAMSALDRIGESYDVDILQAKADCLKTIGTSRTGDTDFKTLAEQAFSLVDEAVAKNDYLLAKQLAEMAREGARRPAGSG